MSEQQTAMTETVPETRFDPPPEAAPVQVETRCCPYCSTLFVPRRRFTIFCRAKCRNAYHMDFGTQGVIASVRRIQRGASVVIHLTGPAAERAMKLELKDAIQIVRRP